MTLSPLLRTLLPIALGLGAPAGASALPVAQPWHQESAIKVIKRDIRFSSHGTTLVGTLYMPEDKTGLPAVIAVHGAEVPTREYGLYRHLEQDLPQLGYATFVFDRRGSGASGGDIDESDYQILADDAVAAQKAVAADPHVDARHIGFWGLSQGGWLAVLAAARSPDAAFVVSISAPMDTPADQMAFAVSNLLFTKGYSSAVIDRAIATRHVVEDYLRGKVTTGAAQAALDKVKDDPWFQDIFMGPTVSGHPEQSRWRKEMDYDPVSPLKALNIPVLLLYGSDDPWVPVQASLEKLATILPAHQNITVRVIDGADHMMMPPPASNPMAYDPKTLKNEAPSSPAYFLTLATWLARHTAAATQRRVR